MFHTFAKNRGGGETKLWNNSILFKYFPQLALWLKLCNFRAAKDSRLQTFLLCNMISSLNSFYKLPTIYYKYITFLWPYGDFLGLLRAFRPFLGILGPFGLFWGFSGPFQSILGKLSIKRFCQYIMLGDGLLVTTLGFSCAICLSC